MTWLDAKKKDLLLTGLVIVGLVIGLSISMAAGLAAAAYGYENAFRGRIFPGVRVAGVRLDGLTPEAARQRSPHTRASAPNRSTR